MRIYNTPRHYGLVSIVFHWLMALLVFGLLALGLYMVELTYYDALYNTLPFIHKSIGIMLALLFFALLVWRLVDSRTEAVNGISSLEQRLAIMVHRLLYLLIAVILLSGYLISTADGSPISVFGWFSLPATISGIYQQEDIAGLIHRYLAYVLIALIVLHVSAALKHHFVNHDNTLVRMLGISNYKTGPETTSKRSQKF